MNQLSAIAFGFAISNGRLFVREGGVDRGILGFANLNDELRVTLEGGKIRYYVNNYLVYTSTGIPGPSIYLAASCSSANKSNNNLQIYESGGVFEFTSAVTNGGMVPFVNWFVNGQLVQNASPEFISGSLKVGDVVQASATNKDACGLNAASMSAEYIVKGVNNTLVSTSSPHLCEGVPVSITVAPTIGASYSWYDNGVLIAGQNSNVLTVSTTGGYYATVEKNGCLDYTLRTDLILNAFASLSVPSSLVYCPEGQYTENWITGISNKRTNLYFNGSSTRIQPVNKIQVSNTFTFECWANPQGSVSYTSSGNSLLRYIVNPEYGFDRWGVGHSGVGIAIGTNGVKVVERYLNVSAMPATDFTKEVINYVGAISGWNHIAVVYSAGVPSLFLNGIRVSTGAKTGQIPHLSTTYGGGGKGYFMGGMDDLRIWRKARTAAEIISQVNSSLKGNEDSLELNWLLDEGMGAVIHDLSPNARHETINLGSGFQWQGYKYTWETSDDIVLNFGTRIKIAQNANEQVFKVSVNEVGNYLACTLKKEVVVYKNYFAAPQVSEDKTICASQMYTLSAERFPYFYGGYLETNGFTNVFPYTVSMWVNANGSSNASWGLFSIGNEQKGLMVYLDKPSGELRVALHGSGPAQLLCSATYPGLVDRWFHVALTINEQKEIGLLIDGKKMASGNLGNVELQGKLIVGKCFAFASMMGYIRDVRSYYMVLDEQVLSAIVYGMPLSEGAIRLHYPMTEGLGSYAYDASGYAQTARFYGNVSWMNDESSFTNYSWSTGAVGHQMSATAATNTNHRLAATSVFGCTSNAANVKINMSTTCQKVNYAVFSYGEDATQIMTASAVPQYAWGTGNFTLEARVRTLSGQVDGMLLSASNNGFSWGLNTVGQPTMWIRLCNEAKTYCTVITSPAIAVPLNRCSHLAVTRVGTQITFYVNGAAMGASQTVGSDMGAIFNSNISTIGLGNNLCKSNCYSGHMFNGQIFEIRMWNIGRTAAQLLSNMTTVFGPAQANLVADWDLENLNAQVITDRSSVMNPAYLGFTSERENEDPSVGFYNCESNTREQEEERIIENLVGNQLWLFPNPSTQSQVNIRVSSSLETTAQIQILDVNLKVLQELSIACNAQEPQVLSLKPGVYFVYATIAEELIVQKLVVL
ncbi:MAG: T9SS type A sorting domain-containing protein [Cytophagaceae bacterium]|nr:T9SS type A sorting domain-containing protein [Cytophagaceae bacterium]